MNQDLAALVGSRICHDLISPIGAIHNGVELLEMTNTQPSEELGLIGTSAEHASARIQFFRIAFGSASAGQTIKTSEIRAVLQKVSHSGRYSYDWNSDLSVLRHEAQMTFLAIQCFETSLPSGGEIKVLHDGQQWTLATQSAGIQVDDTLWSNLTEASPQGEVKSAHVQFALLPELLRSASRTAIVEHDAVGLSLRF